MDDIPDSKVHGANMGPIWGRQDPGGPHKLCYLGSPARIANSDHINDYKQPYSNSSALAMELLQSCAKP